MVVRKRLKRKAKVKMLEVEKRDIVAKDLFGKRYNTLKDFEKKEVREFSDTKIFWKK